MSEPACQPDHVLVSLGPLRARSEIVAICKCPIRVPSKCNLVDMAEKRVAGSIRDVGLLPSCPSIGVTQGFHLLLLLGSGSVGGGGLHMSRGRGYFFRGW